MTTQFTDIDYPTYEVRVANEKRNTKIADEFLAFCFICNRPVDTRKASWVHMSTKGGVLPITAGDDHPDSQGWFEIGTECVKQLPKQYRKSAKEWGN
jgi:hypothetical protein